MNDVLSLRAIAKRFGRVQALADASLSVAPGSIVALLGENGAGKTTLMRIAFGMIRPDAGEIRIGGAPARPASPAEAMRLGLGMVHQHFSLVPALSASENVALGGRGWYSPVRAAARLRDVAARTGLPVEAGAPAGSLSAGAQQRLEVVKALSRGVRCLIMDEPTAVLTPQESADLLRFLRGFTGDGGAVVLITHKLREALGVADAITVIRHGRTVLTLTSAEATEDRVAAAMLGEEAAPRARRELFFTRAAATASPGDAAVAAARDLVVEGRRGVAALRGASVALRAGEIVGVTGVDGSGIHELVRVLAGRLTPSSGSLTIPQRIGFVPEDRLRDAVIPEWSIVENVALAGAGSARGRVPWRRLARSSAALMRRFDVRADSPLSPVEELSGGNQQKLVLARELDGEPPLVVVEQPTRGLDIAASAAVHERLLEARERGAAVLLATADLDELLMLSDRVLVVFDGRVREVDRDAQAIGRAMLGLDAAGAAPEVAPS